jgi:DNA-binding IclR family transcriptional regulator
VSRWTFLTNHAHVLIHLAGAPDSRIRDIASAVGITERSVQGILHDLEEAGYVTTTKVGRRNTYSIEAELRFRHPAEADHRIGELLGIFGSPAAASAQ